MALGTGDQDDEIRGLVGQLGVEDSVTLRTEWVSEDERIAHFAAADLVVLPSTYEPFGIVCLEAMACGKPVVVGARGVVGFREQVLNFGTDQCGLHVNGADLGGHCLGDRRGAERRQADASLGRERSAAGGGDVYLGTMCKEDGGGVRAGWVTL